MKGFGIGYERERNVNPTDKGEQNRQLTNIRVKRLQRRIYKLKIFRTLRAFVETKRRCLAFFSDIASDIGQGDSEN